MTRETPLWLQAGTYPARLDRGFLHEMTRRQARVFRGLVVTARAAGANFSVDISAGAAMVLGTTQAYQGSYFCQSTAVENRAVPSSPATSRTDGVYAVVNDPNGGGEAGDNWDFVVVAGLTPPENALLIATIARSVGEPAIQTAAIVDVAPRGEWSWTVSTVAPTGRGVPGDLWVVC